MSKQTLKLAYEALNHVNRTTSALPGYNQDIVRNALDALEKALEDPIEKQLSESQEERLQQVEKSVEWLRQLHVTSTPNPVDFPVMCDKATQLNPDSQCKGCTCWKKTFPYRTN